MKVTSIVLAGGKSLRFGRSKIVETILGKTIIEGVVDRLRPLSEQILIVTSREQRPLIPAIDGTEVKTDVYPGKGPLGGIYTGLLAAHSDYSIAVAGDMPFLNRELLRHMLKLVSGFDAVVPRLSDGRLESLHAIYARTCLPTMKMWLEQNQLEINAFIKMVRVRYIEQEECQRFDPQLLSFFNINYQSDLEKALELAGKAKR